MTTDAPLLFLSSLFLRVPFQDPTYFARDPIKALFLRADTESGAKWLRVKSAVLQHDHHPIVIHKGTAGNFEGNGEITFELMSENLDFTPKLKEKRGFFGTTMLYMGMTANDE